ncbi:MULTISPECIES: hypothetical protein [unclassified Oceanobacter]|uniref:hypothetical protein n=1 Tax=unclassified Oceanobacter TaxID=2620260 RepID=UPI00270F26C5|nr:MULTISPECIES: hypothetical protein [unclassified Oceanobacter]MDO6804055.1 hypothetical protein [Wenyingzhuangia sp. 1_MG-2023]MDP2607970.1 hypothetical protein [Oceanobacter sp. 1_MG-2023]MDP2611368.1 hypothetical protein [Oceanobacter sp. 2_MG-2023]
MITKGQWQAIASELSSQFASVTFQLDDDEVTVNRVRLTENKTALAVYINGSIKAAEEVAA